MKMQKRTATNDPSDSILSPDLTKVLDMLEELWGQETQPPDLSHDDPIDGLILTVLSQNTNDRNRDRAFACLKEEFPHWEMVMDATEEEIQNAIRVAGIAKVKAGRIKNILRDVNNKFGKVSLKDMNAMKEEELTDYLNSLPGVGPKTVACVLVFELGIPSFPVDTHVNRFCKRMGWVGYTTPPFVTQELMEKVVPEERKLGAHLNIIKHGRSICFARNPNCEECPLSDLCTYVSKTPSR